MGNAFTYWSSVFILGRGSMELLSEVVQYPDYLLKPSRVSFVSLETLPGKPYTYFIWGRLRARAIRAHPSRDRALLMFEWECPGVP